MHICMYACMHVCMHKHIQGLHMYKQPFNRPRGFWGGSLSPELFRFCGPKSLSTHHWTPSSGRLGRLCGPKARIFRQKAPDLYLLRVQKVIAFWAVFRGFEPSLYVLLVSSKVSGWYPWGCTRGFLGSGLYWDTLPSGTAGGVRPWTL